MGWDNICNKGDREMTTEHECTERDRLERIEELLETLVDKHDRMHRKMFESNGERALVEIIRENTEWRTRMDGMFKKAVAGVIGLVVSGHALDKLVSFLIK